MLDLHLYIHSAGAIVPAADIHEPAVRLLCKEPDYSSFITPMQLRRMSKVVRMGIGASRACMKQASIERPDAISVGTAMGCLQDTEFFLSKMTVQEEKMLTPTAFIQSTHNTVAGQIALLCGCHGHNMTYVHRGHSFEHAMINSSLYLADHPGETVLTGAIDELTESSHLLMQRAGVYTTDPVVPSGIFGGQQSGAIAGEGAVFFMVSNERTGSRIRISNLQLVVTPDHTIAQEALLQLLAKTPIQEIDLVLLGYNGTAQTQPFYESLSTSVFSATARATFKQECGEYATAGAYGLALLWSGITTGEFPPSFFINANRPQQLRRILMVNNYLDHYSYWLLDVL